MACCLTAPSHYLNQCWLIISEVPWHSSQGIIIRRCKIPVNEMRLKIAVLKWHPGLPGSNELIGVLVFLISPEYDVFSYFYLQHSCSPNVFVQNVFVDTHDLRFPWVAFFAAQWVTFCFVFSLHPLGRRLLSIFRSVRLFFSSASDIAELIRCRGVRPSIIRELFLESNRLTQFLAATKQLYEWFSPSVRPSVCPSHLFSCDQAALQMVFSVCLSVRPSVRLSVTPFWLCSHHRIIMKFSGVITNYQRKVHAKGQGQRSKIKVTEVTTQLNRFRTVTPVWIHQWLQNDA